MALSGTSYAWVGARWKVQLEWSATQNISNNTSTITARLYWMSTDSYGAVSSSSTKNWSITIDGTRYTGTTTAGLSAGQKKLIGTASKTVTHNGDGTRSVSISGVFDMEVTLHGTYYRSKSTSGTYSLNRIPRTSSFTLSSSSVNTGTAVTISINRASSSFTHTIAYKFGSATGTIASQTTSTSVSWTPPHSLLSQIPNSVSGSGTITVTTYSGSTAIGSTSKAITLSAPASVVPTFTSLTVAEQNTKVPKLMGSGVYVQGHSNLRFNINGAAGTYSSTIKSYKISFNGSTYNGSAWNYGVIGKSGTLTATATITDSRGRTATKSISVTIMAYTKPTLTNVTANRNSTTPTTVVVTRTATYSPLTVGTTVKNSLTVTVKYKERSATTYTTSNTTTSSNGSNITGSVNITGLDSSKSFDILVTATDALGGETTTSMIIGTERVLLDLGRYGIGVGKRWDKGLFDIEAPWGLYIDAKENAAINFTQPTAGNKSYFANFRVPTADNHVVVFGAIDNYVGFSGFFADRTANGRDWYCHVNASNGFITHTGGMQVQGPFYSGANGQSIVASGTGTGAFMHENQVVTLDKPIEECSHGLVLVWSRWIEGTGSVNSDWQFTFVPKKYATYTAGGMWVPLTWNGSDFCFKYIYVNSTAINGHARNDDGNQRNMVLRDVWEV